MFQSREIFGANQIHFVDQDEVRQCNLLPGNFGFAQLGRNVFSVDDCDDRIETSKLLELRNSLSNLRSSLIGNDKLETLLQEMIQSQEMLQKAGSEAGVRAPEEKEK